MGRSLFTNVCQTLSNWGSRLYGAQPHDDTMQVKVSGKAAWGTPKARSCQGFESRVFAFMRYWEGVMPYSFLNCLIK